MMGYCTLGHTFYQLFYHSTCYAATGNLRDASNELLNTHKIPIDSQCNDGRPEDFEKL